jgi:hypothetical protein
MGKRERATKGEGRRWFLGEGRVVSVRSVKKRKRFRGAVETKKNHKIIG